MDRSANTHGPLCFKGPWEYRSEFQLEVLSYQGSHIIRQRFNFMSCLIWEFHRKLRYTHNMQPLNWQYLVRMGTMGSDLQLLIIILYIRKGSQEESQVPKKEYG